MSTATPARPIHCVRTCCTADVKLGAVVAIRRFRNNKPEFQKKQQACATAASRELSRRAASSKPDPTFAIPLGSAKQPKIAKARRAVGLPGALSPVRFAASAPSPGLVLTRRSLLLPVRASRWKPDGTIRGGQDLRCPGRARQNGAHHQAHSPHERQQPGRTPTRCFQSQPGLADTPCVTAEARRCCTSRRGCRCGRRTSSNH